MMLLRSTKPRMRRLLHTALLLLVPLVARAQEPLPMDYNAVMANLRGQLVARATECGIATDLVADESRIAILLARDAALSPEEVVADTEIMEGIAGSIRQNILFANTPCMAVQIAYNGFEAAPSKVARHFMASGGSNRLGELVLALAKLRTSEEAADAKDKKWQSPR